MSDSFYHITESSELNLKNNNNNNKSQNIHIWPRFEIFAEDEVML